MIRSRHAEFSPLVVRCVALLACIPVLAPGASAQGQGLDEPSEAFAKIDPYTKGERKAIDQAGYVSFGPFPWCARTVGRNGALQARFDARGIQAAA
jgi:hypothetical protein